MAANFNTITTHPKFEEITEKLLKGSSPAEVAQWLKLEYPDKDEAHLRISEKLLKDFSKIPFMDVKQQVMSDLKKVETGEMKQISQALLNNKTYQERLIEFSQETIDMKKELIRLKTIFEARMEQVFDLIQQDPTALKDRGDYKLLKYLEQYLKILENYDRSINNRPDQVIQHNYTMEYVDKRTAALQSAIMSTLNKIGPEATSIFMEEMDIRMQELEFEEETKNHKLDMKLLND